MRNSVTSRIRNIRGGRRICCGLTLAVSLAFAGCGSGGEQASKMTSFSTAESARSKAESLTRVLYPADGTPAGQELRLRQEFFFSSASLQDIIRRS